MTDPGPADSRYSGAPRGAPEYLDPRSEEVRVELDRIERRWIQLPLERAQAALPRLRAVLDTLTREAARPQVADLGPGPALHQLKVLVWEAAREGRADGIPALLAALRRDLP